MHDDLAAVARRRAFALAVVFGASLALGPALLVALAAHSALAGVVAFAVAAPATVLWLVSGAPGLRVEAWPRAAVRSADPQVANINDGIALAHGREAAVACQVDDTAPNVAALDHGGRRTLVVTDGAVAGLTRDQLEAVCAAQLAIAADDTCRRLSRIADVVRVGRVALFAAPFVCAVVVAALDPWIGFGLALLVMPGVAGAWVFGGGLRWWARVAADAACVGTTRYPEPLVTALHLLARYSGPQVSVAWPAQVLGVGGGAWAVEVGPRWTSRTSINGRLTDLRSSEMVEDTRLLVRAALVRRVCLEGAAASLQSYEEVRDSVRRAGRAAAHGGAVTVDGETLGVEGVVNDGGTGL